LIVMLGCSASNFSIVSPTAMLSFSLRAIGTCTRD